MVLDVSIDQYMLEVQVDAQHLVMQVNMDSGRSKRPLGPEGPGGLGGPRGPG